MVYLVTDYYQPAELTGISRAIQARQAGNLNPKLNYYFTTDYFQPQYTEDIEYRITPGQGGVPQSAKFRAWDAENALGTRPGFTALSGELLPLGQRELFTERDRLSIRKADPVQFQEQLARAAARTALATVVRMERLAVDTVLTGVSTLTNERGVSQVATWGRNANRATTAPILWSSTATSTPLVDLMNVREVVDTDVDILMSRPTWSLLAKSASWLTRASIGVVGLPDVVTQEFVNTTLSAFGVGNIRIYDARYGIVTGHYGAEHPKQEWINSAAVGFPVLSLPDDTYVLTVT